MKRNQNCDHNHSQKLLSFRYNIDTNLSLIHIYMRIHHGTKTE